MIVCICNAVTRNQLEKLIEETGTTDYYELQRILGVGRDCGSCTPKIWDVIFDVRNRNSSASSSNN